MKFKYVCKCISFYGVSQKNKKKKIKSILKTPKKILLKKEKKRRCIQF